MVVTGGFLWAFLFSAKKGQFSDTYAPAIRILFDEKDNQTNSSVNKKVNNVNKPE